MTAFNWIKLQILKSNFVESVGGRSSGLLAAGSRSLARSRLASSGVGHRRAVNWNIAVYRLSKSSKLLLSGLTMSLGLVGRRRRLSGVQNLLLLHVVTSADRALKSIEMLS